MRLLLALVFSAPAFAYEVCTPDNDYLEALLPPVMSSPAGVPVKPAVEEICVKTSQSLLAPVGYYGFCPSPIGKPERTHPRACISEKYVVNVHRALLDVTDCLGYDARLALATFNLESAMHLNAVGRATDVGIGQLTRSAIEEVNLNALARAVRQAKASGKESCQRILPNMTEAGSAIEERCAFMSLPENPVRNVVYSVLLLQQMRRVINNLWNRFAISMPPEVDEERLKSLLTMLAYNSGPGGLVSTLKAYVDQMGEPLTDHHFNFDITEPDSFRAYLAAHFPSSDEAVRNRVSKYINYVATSIRRVDSMAGGNGECLHSAYFAPTFRVTAVKSAPNPLEGQRLVRENLLKLANEFKLSGDCVRDRHAFLMQFVGPSGRAELLPEEIRGIYANICSGKFRTGIRSF